MDLDIDLRDGALWLTMNRPEVFNAMSGEMCLGLAEEIRDAGSRDDVRVVVITGTGVAFSTGADISGDNAIDRFDVMAMDAANALIRAIVDCPTPVLAAVNGIAAGVSASAALASDIIVAKESAAFLLAFARVGFMPDGGSSASVAASIGRARAMRMALLAEPLPAGEAYAAGLITHVAPDADYDDLVDHPGAPTGRRGSPGPDRDEARDQRRHADRARERPRARAHRPGRADAHRRCSRGHERLQRAPQAGLPRSVAPSVRRPAHPSRSTLLRSALSRAISLPSLRTSTAAVLTRILVAPFQHSSGTCCVAVSSS